MSTITYSVSTAIAWGELVKSAYSTYSADTKNTNPAVPVDLPDGWTVLANIQCDPVAGFFSQIQFMGFVVQSAADPTQIGIVYRGTEGVMDWLADFEAEHTDFTDIQNGGRTELGFTRMFRSSNVIKPGETETRTLESYVQSLPASTCITVTGHSLGGAIANLTGAWIAATQPHLVCELYTFAAPMTGDATFAATFNTLVPNSFRIYNQPDVVPKSPLHIMGYDQVNTGIEVNSLDFPEIKKSILSYHSLDTYLFLLRQQL